MIFFFFFWDCTMFRKKQTKQKTCLEGGEDVQNFELKKKKKKKKRKKKKQDIRLYIFLLISPEKCINPDFEFIQL